MTATEYSRYHARITRHGFSPEEALSIPKGKPLWMARIEAEEGMDMPSIVARERRLGLSDAMIAASFEVKKDTLGHWIRKWKRAGLLDARR